MIARERTTLRVAQAAAALAGGMALSMAAPARAAAPVCNPGVDTSGCCYTKNNPVFVAGTSAAKSALQAIASQLPEISIIYQTPDSCIALSALEASPPQAVTGS